LNVVTTRANIGPRKVGKAGKVRASFKVCLTLSQPGLTEALERWEG